MFTLAILILVIVGAAITNKVLVVAMLFDLLALLAYMDYSIITINIG